MAMSFFLPRKAWSAAFVLGLLAAMGCYSFSTLQEPDTLAPGAVRGVAKVRLSPRDETVYDNASVMPALELELRVGLLERVELQLGASSALAARLGVKALVADWDALTLAVVPTYQIQHTVEDEDRVLDEEFLPSYRTQSLITPLIAGVRIHERLDLLLGADAHVGRRVTDGGEPNQSAGFFALGVHFGLALHSRAGYGTFVPQCGVLTTVWGSPSEPSSWRRDGYEIDDLRAGNVLWECAVGMSFGARYTERR